MPEIARKPLTWFKDVPQIREELGPEAELRSLGESLRVRQISPVGAMSDGEPIWGFRRIKAAWLVGLPDLEVKVFSEPLSATDIKILQISENIQRRDMTSFEKWQAYEELRKLNPKWTAKELGQHLKIDQAAVTRWLSPSKCIAAWQDALRDGSVGITDVYYASQAPEEEQLSLLQLKRAGASRDALKRTIERSKSKPSGPTRGAKRATIPLPGGSRVVVTGDQLTLPEIVEILNKALAAAREATKERLDVKAFETVMRSKSQPVGGGISHVPA